MEIKDITAANIKAIADKQRLKSEALGDKSGLSQRTAYRLMTVDADSRNPNLKSLEAVSKGLDIEIWKLFFENMPIELFEDKNLNQLIKLYSQCSEKNRTEIFEQIEKIATTDQMEKRLIELEEKSE